jgi:putative CocE/NonD family hydrolase
MRDGLELSTDVYLPAEGGPFPVLLNRNPYNNNLDRYVIDAVYFAQRGYAAVTQDVRGRWDSPGEWYPFVHEMQDGYDTLEWVARQPWSNGKVGLWGASYHGLAQWLAAQMGHPSLAAMVPRVATSHQYHHWVYTGGAFQLGFNFWWCLSMSTHTTQVQYLWFPEELHLQTLYWHLPLITMDEAAGRRIRHFRDWIGHPTYDDYWRSLRPIEEHYGEIGVPAFGIAGWFDVFLQGSLNNFMGMTKHGRTDRARRGQRIIVGPWIHDQGERGTISKTGDIDFGPAALIDLRAEEVRWFDSWLKGIDNGILGEPRVKLFVMGANRWREADEWPLPETRVTPYYFHSGGQANSLFGDGTLTPVAPGQEPADRYAYDPRHPVPTVGGSTCCAEDTVPISMGPRDQRPVEWRPDVLVYTSPVLETDLEVTGPVQVVLFAASSARDTDFTAKLVDVFPSGYAMNVAQGILRARYRDSWEHPTLLEPGRIYQYGIDLWSTSNCFLKGHRLRVDISSSNFPQFDRNPNTGHPFGQDAELEVARQTVYHEAGHPSHILLPNIP